jgi:hypothetical protein
MVAVAELGVVVIVVNEKPMVIVRLVQPSFDSIHDDVKIPTLHGDLEIDKSWVLTEYPFCHSRVALAQ